MTDTPGDMAAKLEALVARTVPWSHANACLAMTQAASMLRECAEREKWLPIETAPKDGSDVDLWIAWGNGAAREIDASWITHLNGKGVWYSAKRGVLPIKIITHWRPRPAPPEIK